MAKKPTPTKPVSKHAAGGGHSAQQHLSKQTKKKISKALTGRSLSKTTKAKISRSLKHTDRQKKQAIGKIQGVDWILGANDLYPTCVTTAIANHRWLATGYKMTDEEILQLEEVVDGNVEAAFEALGADVCSVDEPNVGTVLAMSTPYGMHAVLYGGEGVGVSWGGLVEVQPQDVREIWYAEWTPEPCGLKF